MPLVHALQREMEFDLLPLFPRVPFPSNPDVQPVPEPVEPGHAAQAPDITRAMAPVTRS